MYKTILVHVNPDDPGISDTISCAVNLAHDYRAKLIGVAAGLPEPMVEVMAAGAPLLAGGMVIGDEKLLARHFANARDAFDRSTSGMVETAWRTAIDFPARAISTMSAAADLIVISSQSNATGLASLGVDCGDLVMRAGRPVLVVPRGKTKLDLATGIVAWKNTREARRAVADALPLLAMVEMVTVVHVPEGDEEDPMLVEIKEMLDRHCIGSSVRRLDRGPAAEQIIDFAIHAHADLIVAGAYGHSRLREWAL